MNLSPLQAKNRNALKMFIYRHGETVPYYNREEVGRNRLNKPDIQYEYGGEALALRYNHNSRELELDVGEYNNHEPQFMVPFDSPIKDDCHIIYRGYEYEMVAPDHHGAYVAFQSKKVHVLTEDNSDITVFDEESGEEIPTPVNVPGGWDYE